MAIRAAVLALALALPLALSAVHAAGGHHAVDDAALIEPGQCEFESWAERERGAARTLLHAGLAAGPGRWSSASAPTGCAFEAVAR